MKKLVLLFSIICFTMSFQINSQGSVSSQQKNTQNSLFVNTDSKEQTNSSNQIKATFIMTSKFDDNVIVPRNNYNEKTINKPTQNKVNNAHQFSTNKKLTLTLLE